MDDTSIQRLFEEALRHHHAGDLSQAEIVYRKALALKPDYAEANNNLGIVLMLLGRSDEAIAAFQAAVQANPNYAGSLSNLGNLLKDSGRLDEALNCFDRAIAADPTLVGCYSNRLYALYFHPKYDGAKIFAEHAKWNQSLAEPFKKNIQPFFNDQNPNRKIRIGYVSSDFRNHCQSFFTIPLLSNHDHAKFEIVCYADLARPDEITRRIQTYCDRWQSTVGLNDDQMAQLIRSDRIDILIDLAMHMSGGRPYIFARKPAPIQIAWLAYPGTTGLSTMDYRLTDPYLDPPGSRDEFYSEKSIRLPHTFWCYDPLTDQPQVNPLPALSNGYITFGCLNNFCKVNDGILSLWSQVLAATPNSRLILLSPPGEHRQRVLEKLNAAPQRVEFVPMQPRENYLQTYHRIDLGLDTFPYNGHTTTLDGLWMGVPVVSLMGQTAVSRAGLSQMSNMGLADEFVATTENQFVEIATQWASDFSRLSQLRSTLRLRLQQSPLMNGKLFAKNVEAIYTDLFKAQRA
jgi:protein O-GlcNAc transferase